METINTQNSSEISIPMSHLNSGTYFIQVQTDAASKTFKVSKH